VPKNKPKNGVVAHRAARGTALCVAAVLAFAGCSVPPEESDSRPLVVTTFTVIADLVSEVGGDRVRVESITRVGAEIHGYEPTPGDLRRAQGAALIVDNGLALEAWFEQFLGNLDVPRVVASEGIEPVLIAGTSAPNPHAWMSPVAAERYVENIRAALTELDPAGEAVFARNAEAYTQELRALAAELTSAIEVVPEGRRVLVTCEGAFSYLARDLGLAEQYIWPVNAEQQSTPQRIADTIRVVQDREVPAVFCESTVSADPMLQVAESTGARYAGELYVDSLSEPDGPVPTYLELLRYDLELIIEGLTS
jgi:manganese transport system substrate-binding protein